MSNHSKHEGRAARRTKRRTSAERRRVGGTVTPKQSQQDMREVVRSVKTVKTTTEGFLKEDTLKLVDYGLRHAAAELIYRARYYSVEAIMTAGEAKLREIPGIGPASIKNMKDVFASFGFTLAK